MAYNDFLPPLRLVLNSECNGKCEFCHREGNENGRNFSMALLDECIGAINGLNIENVSLTGGEPTLYRELVQVIHRISDECRNAKLSLTTNGVHLCQIIPQIKYNIYGINLSIISFSQSTALKYQNVYPQTALKGLKEFQADNKNLNIMILEENYQEFDEWVAFCSENGYNLDIMFLDRQDADYRKVQKNVFDKLAEMRKAQILLQSTPVMQIKIADSSHIRVKHPYFSSLLQREICRNCKMSQKCFEKVCAVRVYGDGKVSPCLSGHIQEGLGSDVFGKIKATYEKLQDINGIYEFLL